MKILRQKYFNEDNNDTISTKKKIALGALGTTAITAGAIIAGDKGLLGNKVRGRLSELYDRLGKKYNIKRLEDRGDTIFQKLNRKALDEKIKLMEADKTLDGNKAWDMVKDNYYFPKGKIINAGMI